MSVYVDYEFATRPTGKWPFKKACHMTADTLPELHAMADRLGLKRAWFQNHPRYPHYDLTSTKRRLAVGLGAVIQRMPVKARHA